MYKMSDTVYLVINRRGVRDMKKKPPALKSGEVAIKIEVKYPSTIFKDHIPSATVEVDEQHVRLPDPEVTVEEPSY